ncbi:transporter substrate-binding domain-containing protein [Corallincola luteus]|uniref:Transporter substrate-binding domain-containing protein n=1 Tax=Corallincola luteus TaxID=1775177 RepID=A0ABY2AR93_9GAMM|nr:transporter substrate-binding domain-containing protein [Corallincola luteus]TCI05537.1 transporter substrate-binding domain-containing protein [Corallincola luteus]
MLKRLVTRWVAAVSVVYLSMVCGVVSAAEPVNVWVDFAVSDFDDTDETRWHSTEYALLRILLPEWRKQTEVELLQSNTGRAIAQIREQRAGCVSNLLLTPKRAEELYFSEPFSLYFGLKLYYLSNNEKVKAELAHISSRRAVSLADILGADSAGRLGVVSGRAYGAEIDAIIKQPEMRYKLYVRGANDMAEGLLDMLSQGRVDYVLEYPEVVDHYVAEHELVLSSVSLKESNEMTTGHLACAKTAQGQRAIEQFNQVLADLVVQPAYLDAHLAGLPESLQKVFRQRFKQTFLESSNGR